MFAFTGLPLKTNMEMTPTTEQMVRNIHELAVAARRLVRDVDPTDDLMFLRTRSNDQELLISPGRSTVMVIYKSFCQFIYFLYRIAS